TRARADLLPRRSEDSLVEEGTGRAAGQRGCGGGGRGGGVGGRGGRRRGRGGEAAGADGGRGRGAVPGGGGRRGSRAGLRVLLPAAPGVQHPAGGAAAARGQRLLGLAQPFRAARRPGGSRGQEAEPPGAAVRAGDAAPAAARRGLCALRDPFLQEVQEPAQPPGLRGALPSGTPGSA
uniref:Chromosome 17 open reading frame 50 n=1 Tax=Felis catus TaxID=9685 RepID=A0ABI7YUE7_FELCA